MFKLKRRLQIGLLTIMLMPHLSDAQVIFHLKFHMGLGANGQFFVGGTLENQGTAVITHGYLLICIACHANKTIYLYSFFVIQLRNQIASGG